MPFALTPKVTNERSLEAAVKYAADFLNKAVKPVLVGGVKMRWPGKAQKAFMNLSEAGSAKTRHPVLVLQLYLHCSIRQAVICSENVIRYSGQTCQRAKA